MRSQPPLTTPRLSLTTHTSSPMSAPISLQRANWPPPESTLPAGPSSREIRPKPSQGGGGYGRLSLPSENPPKKKRGRPTKAEAQARDHVRTASGALASAAYPTTAPVGSASLSSQPAYSAAGPSLPFVQPAVETRTFSQPMQPASTSSLPFTSGMSISSMLTPVTQTMMNASQTSSLSGRRKRARSVGTELEDPAVGEPEQTASGEAVDERRREGYDSPYARPRSLDIQEQPVRDAARGHEEQTESDIARSRSYQHAHASASVPPDPASLPDSGIR